MTTRMERQELLSRMRQYNGEIRFEEVVDLARDWVANGGQLEGPVALNLGRALQGLSRYEAAMACFGLAGVSRDSAAEALSHQAEVSWIIHDYERAYDMAIASLQLNPSMRRSEVVRDRAAHPYTDASIVNGDSTQVLSHAAFYVSKRGNFGDIALPPTVRELVSSVKAPADWLSVHVHQLFDERRLELVNSTAGLVIGGGGLFLPDTAPNRNSGWQWNISDDTLKRIDVPLAIIAVGYNLFPGQEFTGSAFAKSLEALIDKASVVGLRNHGSVNRIKSSLPADLAEKVEFLPCPTTVLNRIHAHSTDPLAPGTGRVLINAAFDRASRRFGDGYGAFVDQMAEYIKGLQARGAEVGLAAHLPADEKLGADLASMHGISLPIEGLYDMTLDEGYDTYRRASLVVGMRGHATMIPFGLNTPVMSIISHPKMRYFLEDIDRLDWGVDVDAPDLASSLLTKSLDILDNEREVRKDIHSIQDGLLEVVQGVTGRFPALGSLG